MLNWHEIFWLCNESLIQVLGKHEAVFEPGLGTLKGYEAKIVVDQNATLVQHLVVPTFTEKR